MKLGNFRGIDPQYVSKGKKGLARCGKIDRQVWGDFVNNQKMLADAAEAIKINILSDNPTGALVEPEDTLRRSRVDC
jgi:hypothetical protein